MANIILNGNCNRKCVYCFSQLKERNNFQLSLDNLTFICDFFARSKKRKINILGGEPTIHPQFDIFLEYLISRGFVIHVFTNGMVPAATLKKIDGVISRWQLTRQRLKFIVNVNEEKYRASKEKKLQQRTFCNLHDFSTLSFNIFEKDCHMDFLLELIAQNKLIPEIRLGLAAPILGKSNQFLAIEDYPGIVKKINAFSGQCQESAVDLVFDCGFPLCVFSDEEIGKLYKNKTQLKFVCHPIPDIDPDLNVTHCYPLSGYFPKKLTDFRDLQEIYTYFHSILAKSQQAPGIFVSCPKCEYRLRGMCDGGCRAHYLNTRETRGFMNHLTIILKPTNQCNANCLYCSAWEPGEKNKIMSEKTLEILFERIEEWVCHSKRTRKIKIIWHGGEPTLMPPDFFYKTIELEKKIKETHGLEIENNIQSNLLYLDQEKLEMLKRLLAFNGQKRTIGTSFEPLPGIRIIKNGDYTTEWKKSIELLKKNNFPFGIVYVVHRRSLDEFDTLIETFLTKFPRTGIRFNPLYKEGRAMNSACRSLYITPMEWGDFLVKLYRIWESHDKKPGWQPLKEIDAFHFKLDSRTSCDLAGKCGTTHLGIDTDGTVYSCGRGIDRKYNSYGNIRQTKISEILTSPSRMAMTNRSAFLENTYCHGCKWWQYCHGGCPMDAAINNKNDIFRKSNFCLSRQRFLETIYKEPTVEKKCCSKK